jgi:hypothetical protein
MHKLLLIARVAAAFEMANATARKLPTCIRRNCRNQGAMSRSEGSLLEGKPMRAQVDQQFDRLRHGLPELRQSQPKG